MFLAKQEALYIVLACCVYAAFSIGSIRSRSGRLLPAFNEMISNRSVVAIVRARSKLECGAACQNENRCHSFFYNPDAQRCQLHSTVLNFYTSGAVKSEDTSYIQFSKAHSTQTPKSAPFIIDGSLDKRAQGNNVSKSDSRYTAHLGQRIVQIKIKREETSGGCPYWAEQRGYHYESAVDVCYIYRTDSTSWDAAYEHCANDGGHLLFIQNEPTHTWLVNLLYGSIRKKYVFIDGTDRAVENTFKNYRNQTLGYTRFDDSEPNNNYIYGEDCIGLYEPHSYRWADFSCESNAAPDSGYVCQITID